MYIFKELESDNDLREIIQTALDTDLDIEGSWGYTQALATIINSTDMPLKQFEHIFASMRAYIEMNMTQEEANRYGSINLKEISREQITSGSKTYDKVTYECTAMKEDLYAAFIKEYKEKYGEKDFDLARHFKKREEATLRREVIHWFQIDKVI